MQICMSCERRLRIWYDLASFNPRVEERISKFLPRPLNFELVVAARDRFSVRVDFELARRCTIAPSLA
jgi:hypothetical protein